MSSELSLFFDERKIEVEEYYKFLEELALDTNPRFDIILNNDSESEKSFSISDSQIKIFKSNCYLLLYNTIEGTINKSLEYIFDSINDNQLKYKELIKEIKAIWIKNKVTDQLKNDMLGLVELIDDVADNIFDLELKKFLKKHKSYFASGNLDAKSIRESVCPKIGLDFIASEGKLRDIKDYRNKLAHGEKSFSEISQNKLFSELNNCKVKTFTYLESYITAVNLYVSESSYKLLTAST